MMRSVVDMECELFVGLQVRKSYWTGNLTCVCACVCV